MGIGVALTRCMLQPLEQTPKYKNGKVKLYTEDTYLNPKWAQKKKAENEEQKHTSPSIGVITLTMKWTLCPKQGQDCQRSKIHSVRSILESDKKNRLKVEGWEKIHRADSNHKRSQVAILMSGEKEVKTNRKSNNKKARILEGRIINTRS